MSKYILEKIKNKYNINMITEKQLYNLIINIYTLKLIDTKNIPKLYIFECMNYIAKISNQIQARLNANTYDFNINELAAYIGATIDYKVKYNDNMLKSPELYNKSNKTKQIKKIVYDIIGCKFYNKALDTPINELKNNTKKQNINYFTILTDFI